MIPSALNCIYSLMFGHAQYSSVHHICFTCKRVSQDIQCEHWYTYSLTVVSGTLTSPSLESKGRNESCPGEAVEIQCNISFTHHRWRITFLNIVADLNNNNQREVMPPFTFNVEGVIIENGRVQAIVSTATTTASAQINGTTVSCENGLLVVPDPNPVQLTIKVAGNYV